MATEVVKENILKAAEKARQTFNSRCKATQVYTGLVLYKIPTDQEDTLLPVNARPKRIGPYCILRQIGPLTYDIQRVGEVATQQAHHRQLKNYLPRDPDKLWNFMPTLPAKQIQEFEVSKITDHVYDQPSKQTLFKVQWKGYSKKDDIWEPAPNFQDTGANILAEYLLRLTIPPQ